jgi:hypothetical protein
VADDEITRRHEHDAAFLLMTRVNRRLHGCRIERGPVASGAEIAYVVNACASERPLGADGAGLSGVARRRRGHT